MEKSMQAPSVPAYHASHVAGTVPVTEALGHAAREQQDCANGTRQKVVNQYTVKSGARHIVLGKALRRSIADAYAAFVGQVDQLPGDDYGLALYALERAYAPDIRPTGAHDLNLTTSPFCTSKAKHAAIFNTARHILNVLDGYGHKVADVCPQQLKQLAKRQPIKQEHPYKHVCDRRPGKCEGLKPGRQHIGIPATRDRAHCKPPPPCAAKPEAAAAQGGKLPHHRKPFATPHQLPQQRVSAPGAVPANVACAVTSAAACKVAAHRQGVSCTGGDAPAASTTRPQSAACLLPKVRHAATHLRVAEYYHKEANWSSGAVKTPQQVATDGGHVAAGSGPIKSGPASDAYPYRLPQHGQAQRVHPLVAPHQSICEVLGFTMTDAQLLKLIKKHRASVDEAEQRQKAAAEEAASQVVNNRSRRLAPPQEHVMISRQCNVPIMAVPHLLQQCAQPLPPAADSKPPAVIKDAGQHHSVSTVHAAAPVG